MLRTIHDSSKNTIVNFLENFEGTVFLLHSMQGNSSFSLERNVYLTGSKIPIIFSNIVFVNYFGKIKIKNIFPLQAEATAELGEVVEGAGGGEEGLEEEEEEEEESQQQQPPAAVEDVNEDNSSEPSSSTGTSQLRTSQQQQQQQQALAIETDGGQVRLLFEIFVLSYICDEDGEELLKKCVHEDTCGDAFCFDF